MLFYGELEQQNERAKTRSINCSTKVSWILVYLTRFFEETGLELFPALHNVRRCSTTAEKAPGTAAFKFSLIEGNAEPLK